jgi:hypothetical protein
MTSLDRSTQRKPTRASDALDELLAAGDHRVLPDTRLPKLPVRHSTGILPVAKSTRSEPNSLSMSSERTFSDATTGQTRSMIPSAGLLTDQPAPNLATVNGHLWSN